MLDGSGVHGGQLEALHNAVDFGSVLGTNHYIHHAICGFLLTPEGTVNHAVPLCLLGKSFQMLLADGEHLQLLAAFQHGAEPLMSLGLVSVGVLRNGVERRCDVLCRRAGEFQGNLRTLQTHPNDLLCRIA